MSSNNLTPENLKIQARRMRDHFAEKNIEISHAMALETLAKQYGYKDWNVLSATIKRQSSHKTWPELDDKVTGKYLGHNFTARVLKVQSSPVAHVRRYTFVFEEPIDVVASEHFSSFRKRINCFLDQSLKSVDHKGRADNILLLT